MFLDRFGGPSSSSHANNRSHSPIPRPSSHLAPNVQHRPGLSPRSSSLSLTPSPNASTQSLPASLRQKNGTGSRLDALKSPEPGVRDPLEVLETLTGKRRDQPPTSSPAEDRLEKPEKLAEAIDFGGLSLNQFVGDNKGETNARPVSEQTLTGEQFEEEQHKFQELHDSISGCDDVLKSVESYLAKFETDLGVVSAEIETLQSRSVQLSSQLENRKNVERLLGPTVEAISISPNAIRTVSGGPIDQEWIKALNEIESCSSNIETNSSLYNNVKAIEDVKPVLSELKDKAIERIRDYLVAQIKSMRSPNINAQIIQQQSLVRYKELYGYLSRHHPTLADELSQAYVNTMKWYYLTNFTRYSQALEKIKLHAIDRNDLLGGDPATHRGGANAHAGGRSAATAHDPFALGRRMDVIKSDNPTALSSYLAEEDKAYHSIEVPFRNFNLALIDNISAEYSFMTEMFAAKSSQQASHKVAEIFEPVFALGRSLTKHLIDLSTDCLGVLLCVRLNQQFAFELQRRKVPVADSYINGTNMELWPRFQMIMDMHCESFKRVAANVNNRNSSALSLTGADNKQSSAPHFLTQRFGQFLHGVLSLSGESEDDEPVSNSLGRLVGEFDALLLKLSRASGDPKRRERFLYNNYSLILTIINDTSGKLAGEQKQHFDSLAKDTASKR